MLAMTPVIANYTLKMFLTLKMFVEYRKLETFSTYN